MLQIRRQQLMLCFGGHPFRRGRYERLSCHWSLACPACQQARGPRSHPERRHARSMRIYWKNVGESNSLPMLELQVACTGDNR